jgi:hypothetical protein
VHDIGSVARSGDRVRITVQLIEARTDRHMWAKSYEPSSRDVLALQVELARDIASEIRVTLSPAENARLAGTHAIDPEAYDDYLRGRYFWARRTEPELKKAREYFEKAIAKDPSYAPAYSGLADTYIYLGYLWVICRRAKRSHYRKRRHVRLLSWMTLGPKGTHRWEPRICSMTGICGPRKRNSACDRIESELWIRPPHPFGFAVSPRAATRSNRGDPQSGGRRSAVDPGAEHAGGSIGGGRIVP